MRKMDRIAIKEVLKKRQIRSMNSSVYEVTGCQPSLITTNKQITFDHILEKINKNDSKVLHKCELTLQQKYALIELISQKQNISYNRNTLAALMTIWKCPNICYFDNSKNSKNDSHLQNLIGEKGIQNLFLLQGHVQIFQRSQVEEPQSKKQEVEQEYYPTFETQSKPKCISELLEGRNPKIIIKELFGWGNMFKRKEEHQKQYQNQKDVEKAEDISLIDILFKIRPSIFVEFKTPQLESMLINLGGMDQDKKFKIIEQFPIFSNISRKFVPILPYIELKRYTKSQYIYKMKQNPHSVYLIIRGEVIFEVKAELPKPKKNFIAYKNLPNDVVLQTQALGLGNYFGEEEIIFKTPRNVNALCHSAQCDLLQIPIDKFDKLLTYNDFYQELKLAADFKIQKRKSKIQKALQIYLKFNKNSETSIEELDLEERKTVTLDKKISIKKKPEEPVKIMHGNIIRKIHHNPSLNQTVNFSMLGANPDMYEATLKKFRKYTMKPVQKYKPDVNWNLKRVWKVLNLESILREETEVASPEGRKFYQSHRRLQNHVQQVKSLRPKTSSSTYRTKLQYIAYLQQFNS